MTTRDEELRKAVFGQVDLATAELEISGAVYDGWAAAIMVRGQPRTIAMTREYSDAVQIMALIDRARSLSTARDALRVAVSDIAAERQRQVDVEGWSEAHDDEHDLGELGLAAALYALPYEAEVAGEKLLSQDDYLGLDMALSIACKWDLKPERDRRRRLVKAGALIVAEIERLDRAALQAEQVAK